MKSLVASLVLLLFCIHLRVSAVENYEFPWGKEFMFVGPPRVYPFDRVYYLNIALWNNSADQNVEYIYFIEGDKQVHGQGILKKHRHGNDGVQAYKLNVIMKASTSLSTCVYLFSSKMPFTFTVYGDTKESQSEGRLTGYVVRPQEHFNTRYLIQSFIFKPAIVVFAPTTTFTLQGPKPEEWQRMWIQVDRCPCSLVYLTQKRKTLYPENLTNTIIAASVPVGVLIFDSKHPFQYEQMAFPVNSWGKVYFLSTCLRSFPNFVITALEKTIDYVATFQALRAFGKPYTIKGRAKRLVPTSFGTLYGSKDLFCPIDVSAQGKFIFEVFTKGIHSVITSVPCAQLFSHSPVKFSLELENTDLQRLIAKGVVTTLAMHGRSIWVDGARLMDTSLFHREYEVSLLTPAKYISFSWQINLQVAGHEVSCMATGCRFLVYVVTKFVEGQQMAFQFYNGQPKFVPGEEHGPKEDEHGSKGPCVKTKTVPGDTLDNDCDGKIDEELEDGMDNDNDKLIDEDLSLPAPVNGGWGFWTSWVCNVSDCKTKMGFFTRKRYCDRPPADYNGKSCPGPAEQSSKPCTGRGRCYHNCPDGRYDWDCVKKCPVGCKANICTKLYGDCIGCKPGFETTAKCSIECHLRHYGSNCSALCPLQCIATCDHKTGSCLIFNAMETKLSSETIASALLLPLLVTVPCICILCAISRPLKKKKRRALRRQREKEIYEEEASLQGT